VNRRWLVVFLLSAGYGVALAERPAAVDAPITIENTICRSSGIPPEEIARRLRLAISR